MVNRPEILLWPPTPAVLSIVGGKMERRVKGKRWEERERKFPITLSHGALTVCFTEDQIYASDTGSDFDRGLRTLLLKIFQEFKLIQKVKRGNPDLCRWREQSNRTVSFWCLFCSDRRFPCRYWITFSVDYWTWFSFHLFDDKSRFYPKKSWCYCAKTINSSFPAVILCICFTITVSLIWPCVTYSHLALKMAYRRICHSVQEKPFGKEI